MKYLLLALLTGAVFLILTAYVSIPLLNWYHSKDDSTKAEQLNMRLIAFNDLPEDQMTFVYNQYSKEEVEMVNTYLSMIASSDTTKTKTND